LAGGSAGCLAALAARAHAPTVAVTILEKGGNKAWFLHVGYLESGNLNGTTSNRDP
jgi:hypothetical protein